jgi:hypothetical protein
MYSNEMMEFSPDGKPTTRTYLSFGQNDMFNKFLTRNDLNPQLIRQLLQQDVESLYDKPRNSDQALLILQCNASNPSLSESMSFLTDSKLHAAAAIGELTVD